MIHPKTSCFRNPLHQLPRATVDLVQVYLLKAAVRGNPALTWTPALLVAEWRFSGQAQVFDDHLDSILPLDSNYKVEDTLSDAQWP